MLYYVGYVGRPTLNVIVKWTQIQIPVLFEKPLVPYIDTIDMLPQWKWRTFTILVSKGQRAISYVT